VSDSDVAIAVVVLMLIVVDEIARHRERRRYTAALSRKEHR
jgi:hypothetical protein